MSNSTAPLPSWDEVVGQVRRLEPQLYELEPGGAIALQLPDEDWMLEITPDARLICQTGMDMDDIQTLLTDSTAEDLGTDELAKQAKYYLQPAVSKHRQALLGAGFEERTEMNDEYVAVAFERPVDFRNVASVMDAVRWCQKEFRKT